MKWETVAAEVFCNSVRDGTHDTPKPSEHGYKLITGKHIQNGQIDPSDAYLISEKDYLKINERSKVDQWDVLLSMIGNGLGRSAVVIDTPAYAIKNIALFKVGNEIRAKWLHYFFASSEGQSKIYNSLQGSGQPFISLSNLRSFPIPNPPFETMKQAVSIISVFDDLIENNQKQIKLLEEAAQRLYKEWFIDLRFPGYETTLVHDGVPEGWEKRSMNDIADYLNGYAFKPDDWGKAGMPIIKIKELNEGITKDTPRNNGDAIPAKYVVYPGEILFSWSATLTAKIWDSETGLLNQHLFKVTPSEGITREFVLQSILKTLDEFSNLTTGSTMKHIQRGKLKEVSVKVPSDEMMNLYSEKSEPIRERIMILHKQNDLLIEARDRLLPKLMSGEIEV